MKLVHDKFTRGFSLAEMMVTMVIVSLLILMTSSILDQAQRGWVRSQSTVETYRDARVAFEVITRRLSQARLNTYWDYEYDEDSLPEKYVKKSELHFVSGESSKLTGRDQLQGHGVFFQAPLGHTDSNQFRDLNALLNSWGYFIEYGSDEEWMPEFLTRGNYVEPVYRFRLLEFRQPTEQLVNYTPTNQAKPEELRWIRQGLDRRENIRVVADNIIAMIITPMRPPDGAMEIAPTYYYDSQGTLAEIPSNIRERNRHELPPLMRVTMIAVSEESVSRLNQDQSRTPPSELSFHGFFRADQYERDLEALETQLQGEKIEYRVFSTTVAIRSAKWTTQPDDEEEL